MQANLGRLPRLLNASGQSVEKLLRRCWQYFGPWNVPEPEPEPEPKRKPYDVDVEWLQKHCPSPALHTRAAIALKVPNTGMDWLDDMIKQSRQLDLEAARQAAKGGDAS